mmetsp:Transcript_44752/g.104272  ORF Transcript_44752/g.104272 Transcript_44752/m.104272 type:complete len:269 (+) Transcript_44752:33-839(+)
MRRRLCAWVSLPLALLQVGCFLLPFSGKTRGSTALLRRAGNIGLQEKLVEPVVDFAGNGTAFALSDGVLPDTEPATATTRYEVPTFSPGFVVDGVISSEDCRQLVDLCERLGFRTRWSQVGAVTLYMPEEFSNRIFERLKPFLPDHFGGRPVGIHRRWAVLKYEKGQYLNPHIDGHTPGTVRVGNELQKETHTRSYMSCLFWLSDDVEGGETVFTYPQGGIWVAIPPKTGAALLFFHGQNAVNNPMHYGGDVKSGIKYLVRSDIIYQT